MSLTFTTPGAMRGKGRPRFSRQGGFVRAYTDTATVSMEQWVKHCAVEAGATPMEGPLAIHIHMYVDVPQSWSKRKREAALLGAVRPTGKPDLDNVLKLIGDALNGIAWRDDSQLVQATIARFYASEARTTVSIAPWAPALGAVA